MKDRIYYMFAASILVVAIIALVAVLGQNQPTSGQPTSAQSASTLQALFSSLSDRINTDPAFTFRIRVTGSTGVSVVSLGQSASRITDVGADYFCDSKTPPAKNCYPFAQILAIGIPS